MRRWLPLILRAMAVTIALVAFIDPAITTARVLKPDVVLATTDSVRFAALANDAGRALDKRFTVTRGALAGASATVVLGDELPPTVRDLATPIIGLESSADKPNVSILAFDVPAWAHSASRVDIPVVVRATGARGKSLELSLASGTVRIAEHSQLLTSDDDTIRTTLTFVSPDTGTHALRVTAGVTGVTEPMATAVADALVDAHDRPWSVFFYDARPSWMSTFVRRAVERDPRMAVTSQVVTSRSISTDEGHVPRLDDLSALSQFDAVVVGAPHALSAADVTALDTFLRRRGGSVVLLMDDATRGPVDRLTGVTTWLTARLSQDVPLHMSELDSTNARVASLAWPTSLPAGAAVVATGAEHPAVWQEPVGAGTLVVSGALDAWRFRDADADGFDRFWQATVANAAAAAPPPLTLTARPSVVAPGERLQVDVTLRDALLANRPAAASDLHATIGRTPDSTSVFRVWATSPGHLAAQIRAPAAAGVYHVRVEEPGMTADVPVRVASDRRRAQGHAHESLRDWIRASGGQVATPATLAAAVALAVHPAARRVTWHPMRAPWWIVPFALALSGEWWLRRRRGLA